MKAAGDRCRSPRLAVPKRSRRGRLGLLPLAPARGRAHDHCSSSGSRRYPQRSQTQTFVGDPMRRVGKPQHRHVSDRSTSCILWPHRGHRPRSPTTFSVRFLPQSSHTGEHMAARRDGDAGGGQNEATIRATGRCARPAPIFPPRARAAARRAATLGAPLGSARARARNSRTTIWIEDTQSRLLRVFANRRVCCASPPIPRGLPP